MIDELPERINIKFEDLKTIVIMAIEFGYNSCEKGYNKERTIKEAIQTLKLREKWPTDTA